MFGRAKEFAEKGIVAVAPPPTGKLTLEGSDRLLFQTIGHAVWSTTFICSSFIRLPCTFDFRDCRFRSHEDPQA